MHSELAWRGCLGIYELSLIVSFIKKIVAGNEQRGICIQRSPPGVSWEAHAKPSPPRLDTAAQHEAVLRLKDMEGTGEVREGHRTDKHWQVLLLAHSNPG